MHTHCMHTCVHAHLVLRNSRFAGFMLWSTTVPRVCLLCLNVATNIGCIALSRSERERMRVSEREETGGRAGEMLLEAIWEEDIVGVIPFSGSRARQYVCMHVCRQSSELTERPVSRASVAKWRWAHLGPALAAWSLCLCTCFHAACTKYARARTRTAFVLSLPPRVLTDARTRPGQKCQRVETGVSWHRGFIAPCPKSDKRCFRQSVRSVTAGVNVLHIPGGGQGTCIVHCDAAVDTCRFCFCLLHLILPLLLFFSLFFFACSCSLSSLCLPQTALCAVFVVWLSSAIDALCTSADCVRPPGETDVICMEFAMTKK